MVNKKMFVALGLCVHIIFLVSIFDIYFKSPVVKGVVPYQPEHEAGSDRLVLFIVDGLRAESFVNYTTMPYLRSIANDNGRWGISNTRVPTESRPGHVAVIAGFYEDPSAVFKGWKENPVDFDSVLNQSDNAWCWGAYDIIDVFTKDIDHDRIHYDKFDPYNETFSSNRNTTLLDSWVFDRVKEFFEKAKNDDVLNKKLHQKKITFFLHLLGTDTAGHTHKPKTENYLINLKFVDEGIKKMEALIEEFYKFDNKTTFLMTSDHGMTDWGSHGSGDNHETETPYVLWGSGVQEIMDITDNFSENIELSSYRRFDVQQADLAPLMSTILSIPVPVNSVGRVPLSILNMSLPNKAKAIYSNSRQLASQYDKKRLDVETNAFSFLYMPYPSLDETKMLELLHHTEMLLLEKRYEKVIILSNEMIDLSLSGLTYYHNYYQRPLQILITLSFVGWIFHMLNILLLQVITNKASYAPKFRYYINDTSIFSWKNCYNVVAFAIGLILAYFVYAQNLPVLYYCYVTLPVFLWWKALSFSRPWIRIFSLGNRRNISMLFLKVVIVLSGCTALGLSFTHREALSVPLLYVAVWPLITNTRRYISFVAIIVWVSTSIFLILFSFMPVVGKDVHIEIVVLAGILWLTIHLLYVSKILRQLIRSGNADKGHVIYNIVQVSALLLALQNLYAQSKRFENGEPVSPNYQLVAWIIAGLSLVLPLASSQRMVCRLLAVNMSMLTFYLMMSVAHEGLFLVALMLNVGCWVHIEYMKSFDLKMKSVDLTFSSKNDDETSNNNDEILGTRRPLNQEDFRRAFFFLLYIILAFFGTGNISSLNSFEIRWVTCFLTSYKPFFITSLILFKTLIPIITVACCFRTIQFITKAPTGYLNIIVLIFSNIMGIQLLFQVKNTGSWLDIGTSISQYVIVQILTLFIVLIDFIAKCLTEANIDALAHNVYGVTKKHA